MPAKKKREKQINLLPQEEFEASTLGRILHWLLSTFRFLVITTEMIVITAFLSRFYFDSKTGDLNEEIKQKQAFLATFVDFETKFRSVQEKLNVFDQITKDENIVSELITSISNKTPTDIKLASVSFDKNNQITIQADGLSEESISVFIANLNTEKRLTKTALTQVSADNKSAFINFTIISNAIN